MSSVGSITIRNGVSSKGIDRRFKWGVLVDGKKVGDIALGEEKTFELDAAQHSVQAKRDPDLSSELLEVVLDQNRPIRLESGFRNPKGTLPLFVIGCTSVLAVNFLFVPSWRKTIVCIGGATAIVSALIMRKISSRPGARYYLKIVDSDQPTI